MSYTHGALENEILNAIWTMEEKGYSVKNISVSEVLDEINLKNKIDLKYQTINGKNNYSFRTRNQEEIILELKNYITKMKDDNDVIDYLYYEWFNSNRCKNKYEKLLSILDSEYSNKHEELYNVIKLLNCKNV